MQVRLQGVGSDPLQVVDVETAVVFDDQGEPMMLVKKAPKDGILVYDAGDGDLKAMLNQLGVVREPKYKLLGSLIDK